MEQDSDGQQIGNGENYNVPGILTLPQTQANAIRKISSSGRFTVRTKIFCREFHYPDYRPAKI